MNAKNFAAVTEPKSGSASADKKQQDDSESQLAPTPSAFVAVEAAPTLTSSPPVLSIVPPMTDGATVASASATGGRVGVAAGAAGAGNGSAATAAGMNASAGVHPGWQIVSAKSRIDSSTQEDLITELKRHVQNGHKRIALDLHSTRFVSLPVLKVCVEIALAFSENGGNFILIACPEKIKRHFEIYGSLKHIQLLRSTRELWV